MIPYGKQDINQADIDAVVDVLKSDFLTQGPQVPLFEETLKKYTGATHAVVVNSGTSALHIACLALGLGKGDWLWTTPITFVASANCGLYCGAQVDFVDIDPQTYNLSINALEEKLALAEKENRLPKIVVPVHLAGQACEMRAIKTLADRYGFSIIEDASHAIGGRYENDPIGNGRYSDITVFSFHPVKIVTTAEGGAALTNDSSIAEKLELFRCHGITRDEKLMDGAVSGEIPKEALGEALGEAQGEIQGKTQKEKYAPWFYQQIELGFNYRMTELQAALGVSQMTRIDDFVADRQCIKAKYNQALASLPLTLPYQMDDAYSACHLYIIRLNLNEISLSHRQVFEQLREQGIGVNLHYIPVYTQPYFQKLGYIDPHFPCADQYYAEAISLPIFYGMADEQFDTVVNALTTVLGPSMK